MLARASAGVNPCRTRGVVRGEAMQAANGCYNHAMDGPSLETFPNPRIGRDYEITCPEFTSLCPKTGLPDFGEIRIVYVPDEHCLELKALKYYLIGFRDRGIFYEQATNQILDDLVAACRPLRMTVVGSFAVRGGIRTSVTVTYVKPAAPTQTAPAS